MALQLIKLQTGEELLADVTGSLDFDATVTVTDTVVVLPTPAQGGGMGLQFVPWSMTLFADDKKPVILKTVSVISYGVPAEELKAEHAKIFGKIYTPPQEIFLG